MKKWGNIIVLVAVGVLVLFGLKTVYSMYKPKVQQTASLQNKVVVKPTATPQEVVQATTTPMPTATPDSPKVDLTPTPDKPKVELKATVHPTAAVHPTATPNKPKVEQPTAIPSTPQPTAKQSTATPDNPKVEPTAIPYEQKFLAPDFTLQDLNGNTVKLSDYRGKVVVLNFWATWCPYCVQEMPDLNKVNAEIIKDGGAVMFAIDEQESAERVKKYVTSKGIAIPMLMDYDGSVGYKYNVSGLPTTFIINKDGTLYDMIIGATNVEELLGMIKGAK